ncbi:hypothetical protein BOTBODRAFT_191236 [Botryobasidium botryosum FD-172 SS1]|uniref:Major facilitator superfamily (MFS) profile domain-containing protein n=1 Tax=Botryobasidium botryosum (strain FD-172 SS1) TaxID=930990 RepID=A0A067MC66_BOTB1|nr:hypothetical protein BOTBODRAFT_191236 [Botryobasidium botryosum FD-172 SS1]
MPALTNDHMPVTPVDEKSAHSHLDEKAPSFMDVTATLDKIEKESQVEVSGTIDDKKPREDWESPEGGYGWVVVAGSGLILFATLGLVNSWVVFQEYYQTTLLKDRSPSDIAWIGSLQYSLMLLPGLLSGRLFDLGYLHGPVFAASSLLVTSVFLVAECTAYWQFMLAQGLAIGLGGGFLFGPALPIVSHWFRARRATAYGIITGCGSIGSIVLPIAVRKLIPMIGFKWTMRTVGFIVFVALGISNLILRTRLPPKSVKGGLFNLRAFKSAPYSLLVSAVFISYLGLYTVLTYIDVAGVANGLDPNFTFYLVSIANAGSVVGRLAAGILSDRFGPFDVLISFSLFAAVTTYVWPYCLTKASIIILAIFYGMFSAAFIALSPAPIALLGETADLGQRTGMMYTIIALGALVGPPVSGAIHDSLGGFRAVSAYAGSMIILACILLICSRQTAKLAQSKGSK